MKGSVSSTTILNYSTKLSTLKDMKNNTINIHDCINSTYAGDWTASVYKKGKLIFNQTGLSDWYEAADLVAQFCISKGIPFNRVDNEWSEYFDKEQKARRSHDVKERYNVRGRVADGFLLRCSEQAGLHSR